MDDLETIRSHVRALGRKRWILLSNLSSVPLSTLSKFALGHVKEPGYDTVQKIVKALDSPDFAHASASAVAATSTAAA